MILVKDIIKILEEKFPKENAEEWDNVGLLVGKLKKEVKKVQLSIDATEKSIEFAKDNEVDMIITHHPMIFKPVKSITTMNILGRKIIKLIEEEIALYAMHTNLDSTKNGLNDYILKKLQVKESKMIDVNEKEETAGIGRVYTLETEKTVREYADFIKEKLKIKNIRLISDNKEKSIKKVALINGSGMSYWRKVKALGAELFITGDVGYHEGLDAKESGLNILDIGHFESESCFSEILVEELKKLGLELVVFNDGPVFETY